MKIQKAVRDETKHIALGVLILSAVMQLGFALLGRWEASVLWGNLLGGAYAILNFFLLGLTVQKIAADGDEKKGKTFMQFSYSSRMFGSALIAFIGFAVPVFHWVAVVLPLLFPRITIFFMGFRKGKKPGKEESKEA